MRTRHGFSLLAMALVVLPACRDTLATPRPPAQRGYRLPPERLTLSNIGTSIEFFAAVGNIHVEEGAPGLLEKTLTVSAASAEDAAAIAGRCTVSVRCDADRRTRIELNAPLDAPVECVGADTRLVVPGGLALDLRTQAGLLDTRLYSASRASLATREGALLIGSTTQEVIFQSRSGMIELLGDYREARGCSTSGDLVVTRFPPGATLEFLSEAGTTTLLVHAATGVEITYRTVRGQLEAPNDPDLVVTSAPRPASSPWQELTISIRGGSPPTRVFIESEHGHLIVQRPSGTPAATPYRDAARDALPASQMSYGRPLGGDTVKGEHDDLPLTESTDSAWALIRQ